MFPKSKKTDLHFDRYNSYNEYQMIQYNSKYIFNIYFVGFIYGTPLYSYVVGLNNYYDPFTRCLQLNRFYYYIEFV